MKRPGHALRLVAGAFQGRAVPSAEWHRLVETASRGWLTPALHVALAAHGTLDSIPAQVRDYLAFIHERNLERNARLRGQLIEAAGALNRHGIEPVLLKGAVNLVLAGGDELGARILSDLDISVSPAERSRAVQALSALGYRPTDVGHLARGDDAAVIDLHDRPNPRAAPYLRGDIRANARRIECEGAVAHVPSATSRVLHLIVHDMIKEGDYWRLRINPRHLHDLAELVRRDRIEWEIVTKALDHDAGRRALALQAAALTDLYGLKLPAHVCAGQSAGLRHHARLVATGGGLAGGVVRIYGAAAWAIHCIGGETAAELRSRFSRRFRKVMFEEVSGSRL